ncbi:1D-myo-inositol 2-acetamido-2-deoxy-alpha-D-glucopyranoside deacetylase [Mycobacterium kansasii]|uniref:1D-myo-inositol 2-acetamido-2-deoxy-alpha-D-glucopyranoside deacetylase n=1 Tax=Mycobacterium kansasii TaxID=1768 RepID=A0A7G1IGR1_MYCKA|nr:1D-myo-inositol 2-acetamido-2-deoxy-alpha-D-glucopyranoside deacetylase [Mycobacterium kansasii]
MAHHSTLRSEHLRGRRVLGIFTRPDDETLCAGGTLAKYASAGADVRVVSMTRGGAGQIRDASVATRTNLMAVRKSELRAAGQELGLHETRCFDYPDGGLHALDADVLAGLAIDLINEIEPDVVVTFGPDGFSGHPDHIAVGAVVTRACHARRSDASIRLFHCHMPQNRMLLRDRLAAWVVELNSRFKGTAEFVRALSVFSVAHVVALDDVTCLSFSAAEPTGFEGRGEQTQPLRTRSLSSGDQIDPRVTTCIDISDFVGHKIRATAAHRSQYPIDPTMFPDRILREMFGVEYFIQVLPEPELATSLFDV